MLIYFCYSCWPRLCLPPLSLCVNNHALCVIHARVKCVLGYNAQQTHSHSNEKRRLGESVKNAIRRSIPNYFFKTWTKKTVRYGRNTTGIDTGPILFCIISVSQYVLLHIASTSSVQSIPMQLACCTEQQSRSRICMCINNSSGRRKKENRCGACLSVSVGDVSCVTAYLHGLRCITYFLLMH